jgi:hypothetical protein
VRKRTGYLPWLRRREDAPFRDDRLRGGHIGMAVIFRLLDAMRTSSTGSSTSCSGYCRSRWRSRHSRLYRGLTRRIDDRPETVCLAFQSCLHLLGCPATATGRWNTSCCQFLRHLPQGRARFDHW